MVSTVQSRNFSLIDGNYNWTLSIVQGAFFNCSAQISVLKRKRLFNQRGSFVHREFHGTESLIGCRSFFFLVLKIGEEQLKKAPCMFWFPDPSLFKE